MTVGGGADPNSLTTDGGRIFLAAHTGGLVRFDADGRVVWETPLEGSVRASPLVTDDTVYTASRTVFAVSTATGATRWTATETYGSEELFVRDGTLYVVGGGVFAVNLRTHEVEQRNYVPQSPNGTGTVGAAVLDGVAYVTTDSGSLLTRRLTDGEPIWPERDFGYGGVSAPITGADTLFVGTGSGLRAVDPATGQDRWVASSAESGDTLSPRITDGTLYGFDNGRLHAVTTDGVVRWSTSVGDQPGVDIAVGNERVFLATSSCVTGFDRSTGEQRWQATFRGENRGGVEGVATLSDPPLVVVVGHGDLFGFRP